MTAKLKVKELGTKDSMQLGCKKHWPMNTVNCPSMKLQFGVKTAKSL